MASIYKSPNETPALPRQSIFHYLFPYDKSASVYPVPDPDSPAFIEYTTDRRVTRGELESQAKRLATGLRGLGMKRGDVACLFGTNSLEWINAMFGCQAAGIRVSPANYGYTPRELLHQLQHSRASLIFLAPSSLPILFKALEEDKHLSSVLRDRRIVLLCQKTEKGEHKAAFKAVEELWEDEGEAERFENGDENETAFLCYSSGTTGLAKGVETTHYNMTSQVQGLNSGYQPLKQGRDCVMGILPFGHIYGLTMLLHQPLTQGVPVVVFPRFDELSVLKGIEKYRISWALVAPPVVIILVNSPNVAKYDLTSLTGLQSGAAPMSRDLAQALEKRLPNCRVTQAYGLTETSPGITAMTTTQSRGRQGSIGLLLGAYEARLVDNAKGKDVEIGEPGELWVRGPSIMKGYLRNPEATKNTFEGDWFKTGDVAIIDKDGYLFIVDRVKELIKYKGFQGQSISLRDDRPYVQIVPPAELEATLLNHPKVADAGVVGIYSEAGATELPRAYVVPQGGLSSLNTPAERAALSKEITEWIAQNVANHKRLRGGCILVDAIPKSPTGKILRKDLRVRAAKEVQEETQAGRQAKL